MEDYFGHQRKLASVSQKICQLKGNHFLENGRKNKNVLKKSKSLKMFLQFSMTFDIV